MMEVAVKRHFDNLAQLYDYFKRKNWYYYENLKKLYRQLIPLKRFVLEVGCGTGDLISHMDSRKAVGIDISQEMINIAAQKHPKIYFEATTLQQFKSDIQFEYIFFADVIEHIEDIDGTIYALSKICNQNTRVIFSYANPLWEPILLLLEKLSLKMPEGPHYRIPFKKFKAILNNFGFEVVERGWRLIFPAHILFLSEFVNKLFYYIPLVRKLGLIEYIIVRRPEGIEGIQK